MKLSFDMISAATSGAEQINKTDFGISFRRFTEKELKFFEDSEYPLQPLTSAGIRLEFKTDSNFLKISALVKPGSTFRFFAFDVYSDGELIGQMTNIPSDGFRFIGGAFVPTPEEAPLGEFEKEFFLGKGKKTVKIYFPWVTEVILHGIELSEEASFEPIRPKKKMLIYGDSITQGYYVSSPSKSYASRIADELDADAVNKGIGGEFFCPGLAALGEDIEPDYITVAYGTNDWGCSVRDVFERDCSEFYKILAEKYPKSKIFAITPIWRRDDNGARGSGTLCDVADYIIKTAEKYANVYPIYAADFVPADPVFFADESVHPNDEGFRYQAEGILREMKKYL